MYMTLIKSLLGFAYENRQTIYLALGAVAIAVILYLGYRHYTSLVEDLRVLSANNAKLETAIDIQDETLDAQRQSITEWKKSQEALVARVALLQQVTVDATAELERLQDVFAEHDLEALGRQKPRLVERRINSGTASTLSLLECASGASNADCD